MTSMKRTATEAARDLNASDALDGIDLFEDQPLKIIGKESDHIGRPVIVIDAASFDTLKAASREGWRDVPGMNYGESGMFSTDSWVGQMMWMLDGVSRVSTTQGGCPPFVAREGYAPGTPPVPSLPAISRVYRGGGGYCFSG